jgi:RHS repeat-associated protein
LVRITYSSTNNYTAFSYDGAGRRVCIQEIESGTATSDKRFVWDGLSIAEQRAANGTAVQRRYYGSGFQVCGTSGSDQYFYVRDHLGSARAVIDESGLERGRWSFGLWGSRSLNLATSSPVESDLGYTGHLNHERSGLVVAPFRFYDPASSRWVSRDPIGEMGGLLLYGYVGNNPINAMDPLGLTAAFIAGGLANPELLGMLEDQGMDFGTPPAETLAEAGEAAKCVAQAMATEAAMSLVPELRIAKMANATKFARFFYDNRAFSSVSRKYWSANGPAAGRSLHHWLIPQKAKWVPQGIRNAGFNLMELPSIINTPFGGLNQWMGMSRSPWAPVVDWGIRLGVPASIGGAAYAGGRLGE